LAIVITYIPLLPHPPGADLRGNYELLEERKGRIKRKRK
jgi:hypothetical protein